MRNHYLRLFFALLLSAGLVYAPVLQAAPPSMPLSDLTAPEITHKIIQGSIEAGASVQIKATANDHSGIKSVTLYYRTKGTRKYNRSTMHRVDDTNEYAVTLGKDDVVAPGIEYYIEAIDLVGNTLLQGYADYPLILSVVPATTTNVQTEEVVTQKVEAGSILNEPTAEKNKHKSWLWIALGTLALGAIAAAVNGSSNGGGSSGSGGSPAGKSDNATVTINAPVPNTP